MPEKIRVLILEDIPEDAILMERMLTSYEIDFESVLARDAKEYEKALDESPPDIIIADYRLPDVNGLEALATAKRRLPDTPFILVSGSIGEDLAIEIIKRGADDYIRKERMSRLGPAVVNSVSNARKRQELARTNAALTESEQRYRGLFEAAHDVMVVIDSHGRILDVNPQSLERYGYSREKVVGRYLHSLAPFFTRVSLARIIKNFARRRLGKKVVPYEVEAKGGEDRQLFFEVSAQTLKDQNGKFCGAFAILRDITERKHNEEMLRSMSMRDDLTGLYNRRGFLVLAGQLLKNAKRSRNNALLIYADLDHMKWINDTIGHLEGDHALMGVADVLRSTFRESDVIARIGGDEFVVLALETPEHDGDSVISRLNDNLDDYNAASTEPFTISLSIGKARYSYASNVAIEELLAQADRQMYAQKNHKKNNDRDSAEEVRGGPF